VVEVGLAAFKLVAGLAIIHTMLIFQACRKLEEKYNKHKSRDK
jgi:hypothetical protein